MAENMDRVPGPDHRLEGVNVPANIAQDEATGTPPAIPAQVRTTLYVGTLIVDVLAFIVLGILPILEVIDIGKANQIGYIIVTALNMLTAGLAVGYRPTRPGSPIG